MELKHLNAQEFDEALQSGKAAMIDFSAVWCGPCQILAPVMETLADRYEGKALVAKVDVDEQAELARRFGIMSIPTLVVMNYGLFQTRAVGVQSREAVMEMLAPLLG